MGDFGAEWSAERDKVVQLEIQAEVAAARIAGLEAENERLKDWQTDAIAYMRRAMTHNTVAEWNRIDTEARRLLALAGNSE